MKTRPVSVVAEVEKEFADNGQQQSAENLQLRLANPDYVAAEGFCRNLNIISSSDYGVCITGVYKTKEEISAIRDGLLRNPELTHALVLLKRMWNANEDKLFWVENHRVFKNEILVLFDSAGMIKPKNQELSQGTNNTAAFFTHKPKSLAETLQAMKDKYQYQDNTPRKIIG